MTHYCEELGRVVRVTRICRDCALSRGAKEKWGQTRRTTPGTCDVCEYESPVSTPEEWGL